MERNSRLDRPGGVNVVFDNDAIVAELARLFGPVVEAMRQQEYGASNYQGAYCPWCEGFEPEPDDVAKFGRTFGHEPGCPWVSALATFTTPEKGNDS